MVKTNGVEFKKFYADDAFWGDNQWHEDEEVYVEGVLYQDDYDIIPNDSTVTMKNGLVTNGDGYDICSFSSYFRRWRKTQSHSTIIVTCPGDKVEMLTKIILTFEGCEVK